MLAWKNGKMIVIDGEEENRILCELFRCSSDVEKELSIVKAPQNSDFSEES